MAQYWPKEPYKACQSPEPRSGSQIWALRLSSRDDTMTWLSHSVWSQWEFEVTVNGQMVTYITNVTSVTLYFVFKAKTLCKILYCHISHLCHINLLWPRKFLPCILFYKINHMWHLLNIVAICDILDSKMSHMATSLYRCHIWLILQSRMQGKNYLCHKLPLWLIFESKMSQMATIFNRCHIWFIL